LLEEIWDEGMELVRSEKLPKGIWLCRENVSSHLFMAEDLTDFLKCIAELFQLFVV